MSRIVRYEVAIHYQWTAKSKYQHNYSCVVRDHEANDVYGVISRLSDYTWLENAKNVKVDFVGRDSYIVTVKPDASYINSVRIYIRRPMSSAN